MKHSATFQVLLAFTILACFLSPGIARAALRSDDSGSLQVFGLRQGDLNGDGIPEVTEIECSYATGRDLVSVYDFTGMPVGDSWQQVTDFRDDLWIFDTGGDGSAQLIIQFSESSNSLTAHIYPDIDGNGMVAYELVEGGALQISESAYPRVTVLAGEDWVLLDGRPNPNLSIRLDSWGEELNAFESGLLKQLLPQVPDGEIDWEYEIVDQDGDGEADYQLGRLLSFIPRYQYVFRSSLLVDQNPAPSRPYAQAIFWPYLIHRDRIGGRYFDTPPAIAVDWQAGAVAMVGILGYPAEQGYHMLSMSPWEKNQANQVSWENPMAYYDLAEDGDNWAEFMIRSVRAQGTSSDSVSAGVIDVQYIWDQNHDNRWEYQIALGGDKPITSVVDYRDFSLFTVPYAELPGWVLDQDWDYVLLTVGENGGYGGSEGLWTWLRSQGFDANGRLVGQTGLKEYLSGTSVQPPFQAYAGMPSGFRGEYSFEYFDQPRLYFSPLDRRLHLWKAQGGVYNVGDGMTIHYANLDGDAYLDQWQVQQNKVVLQQLNSYPGMLVYLSSDRVILKQTDVSPSLFEALPPRDRSQWVNLQAQLDQHGLASLAASDLLGMLEQLAGSELILLGASGRDFRLTADGFRVVLRLPEAYTLSGENWPALQPQPSGEYVLIYDGGFTMQALTPPALALSFLETSNDLESVPTAYVSEKLSFQVKNLGLQDVHQVLLMLRSYQPGGESIWSSPQTISVLSGEPVVVSFPWTPPAAGDWSLQVWTNTLDPNIPGSLAISAETLLHVEPAQNTTLSQEISAFGVVFPWQVVLLLISFLAAAGLVAGVLFRLLAQETGTTQEAAGRASGDGT